MQIDFFIVGTHSWSGASQFVFKITKLHTDRKSLLAFSVISGEQLSSAERASS